jgi:hypothetical protein
VGLSELLDITMFRIQIHWWRTRPFKPITRVGPSASDESMNACRSRSNVVLAGGTIGAVISVCMGMFSWANRKTSASKTVLEQDL